MTNLRQSLQAATLAFTFSSTAFTPLMAFAGSEAPFRIDSTWRLGGNGSWDYLAVDTNAHLLYIARLNRVMVVDTQTGKLAGEIEGLQHAHGIAFNDQSKVGYISDGGAGTVIIFDRATWKAIAAIPVGKNPDAILFEPTRKLVFVFNGASKNANVIDTASNKVIDTIPMPGKPEFAVTDGAGNVFVNIEDTSQILHIDVATLKVTNSWPLAPCTAPSGLAIDVAHRRLFSVCDNNKMAVVDSTSGKMVATPTIGAGADAVAYDAKHGLVFSSNGESGDLTILQEVAPDRYTTLQTLSTMVGARTLALDSSKDNIYTVTAKLGPKPAATNETPKPRPEIVPDTFVVLVVRR
jgi:YVTN family beta-propeller protein